MGILRGCIRIWLTCRISQNFWETMLLDAVANRRSTTTLGGKSPSMRACTSTSSWCDASPFSLKLYQNLVEMSPLILLPSGRWLLDGLGTRLSQVNQGTSPGALPAHLYLFSCLKTTTLPVAEMSDVLPQSPAGHVFQDCQDAGGWNEASVMLLLAPLMYSICVCAHTYEKLWDATVVSFHICYFMCRYVFDGKPPALKKEELSRR